MRSGNGEVEGGSGPPDQGVELSRRQNELSNVWLSAFFGNEVMDDDYYELQNHLSPGEVSGRVLPTGAVEDL